MVQCFAGWGARAFATFGMFFPASAIGQTVPDIADDYLASLAALSGTVTEPAPRPREQSFASTVGVPSGYVLPHGNGFIAGALSDVRERTTSDEADGSAAISLGFGNAASSLGFEATLGVSSVDPSDFADSGSLNLKFGTAVPSPFADGTAGLSLGVTRAVVWGDMSDEDVGVYAVASSTFTLPVAGVGLPGMVTAGYGTNIGTNEDTDGAIFGLGLGVAPGLSLGTSWYGDELVAGVTTQFRVTQSVTAQIGVSYGDALQENSNGRWVLSVALLSLDLF